MGGATKNMPHSIRKNGSTAAGAATQDVISTRVLVASSDQADLVAAWEVLRDVFAKHFVLSLTYLTISSIADWFSRLATKAPAVSLSDGQNSELNIVEQRRSKNSYVEQFDALTMLALTPASLSMVFTNV